MVSRKPVQKKRDSSKVEVATPLNLFNILAGKDVGTTFWRVWYSFKTHKFEIKEIIIYPNDDPNNLDRVVVGEVNGHVDSIDVRYMISDSSAIFTTKKKAEAHKRYEEKHFFSRN